MAGYTRQSAADIVTGNTIFAAPLNAEFNQLVSAFDGSTGHAHDGSSGNAPLIDLTTSVTGVLPQANGGTGSSISGWEVISATTLSNSNSYDATDLSAYHLLRLTGYIEKVGSSNDVLGLQTSTDNGSTFDNTDGDYNYAGLRSNSGTSSGSGTADAGYILLMPSSTSGLVGPISINIFMTNFNQSARCGAFSNVSYMISTSPQSGFMGGTRVDTIARDAIRIGFFENVATSDGALRDNITGFLLLEGVRS